MILIITIDDLVFDVQFNTFNENYLIPHMLWLQLAYETHEFQLI
jgi:hypothetical protein